MRLIAWVAAFVGGVALAAFGPFTPGFDVPWLTWWLFVAGTAMLGVALRLSGSRVAMAVACVALLAGLARGGDVLPPERMGLPETGDEVVIEAVLVDDPAPANDAVRLRLQAESVRAGETVVEADFLFDAYVSRLSAPTESGRTVDGFMYGDRYSVFGRWRAYDEPRESAGALSAGTAVLVGDDGGNPVRRWLAEARQDLSVSLQESMDSRTAGLATAMLVGDRRHLERTTLEAFRGAGIAHVLAISGLHVAIFGGLALTWSVMLIGRHRWFYLLMPLVAVWGYAALAGMSPSVTRAATMFSVYLAARTLGRQRSVLPALGLAGGVMVALDPSIVGSVSFQLSFAAVFGIAAISRDLTGLWQRHFAERVTGKPTRQRALLWVGTGLAASAGATLITAPIVASTFGAVPLLGALATLLILPALPFLVVFAFASSALGLVAPLAGQVAGWPLWLAAGYASGIANIFSGVPNGIVQSPPWPGLVVAAYYGVAAAIVWRRWLMREAVGAANWVRSATPSRPPPRWAAVGVSLVAVIAWAGAINAKAPGVLEVTFFETDVGDAIFVESPTGTQVLIDGGRATHGAVESVEDRIGFSDRSLDMVLLTHGDQDHVGGLEAVLERFNVGLVADAPLEAETRVYADWLVAVEGHPGRIALAGGELFGLGEGVTLEVLSTGPAYSGANDNDSSLVLILRYGDIEVLLPADLEAAGEAALMARGAVIDADVLVAGHHGSVTSSSERFLQEVDPAAVVVSAGINNPYGHPNAEVVERLQAHVCDTCIYRTDQHGDVTVRTDGERIWVETGR